MLFSNKENSVSGELNYGEYRKKQGGSLQVNKQNLFIENSHEVKVITTDTDVGISLKLFYKS
ncbi:MAG: spore coat protein [Bacillota bacterium]